MFFYYSVCDKVCGVVHLFMKFKPLLGSMNIILACYYSEDRLIFMAVIIGVNKTISVFIV